MTVRGNIPKLYITNFLTGFVFWYSIEKLFMRTIGISTVGIAMNGVVYVATITLLNIPAGILADRWNRIYTLMLGVAALAVSSFIYAHSHGLFVYALGTVIYSLYIVFTSGTFQALTYDSLAEEGREDEYVKHQGRSYGMFLVGVSLASVASGYLAQHLGYPATYLLALIPCGICMVFLWSMHEPAFHKEIEDTKLWQHVKKATGLITRDKLLLYLSMIFVGGTLINSTQNEYFGLYFIALGFGAVGSGWANAGKWLAGSIGQFLSNKLNGYVRWFIPLLFVAFFAFSVYHSRLGLVFFYAATFLQAIIATNVESTIQHHTPSSVRATTLSILSAVEYIIMIPVSIAFGYIAKRSVFSAYEFVAIVGFAFFAVWMTRPASIRHAKLSAPSAEQIL